MFGKTILAEAGTKRVFDEQTEGVDLVLGLPVTFGMGYGLNSVSTLVSPNAITAFWGGYGGSSVIVDQDARLCVSYVMNKRESGLLGDPQGFGLAAAVYMSVAG